MLNKIEEFGFKKVCLIAHYILAILVSVIYFGFILYGTMDQKNVYDTMVATDIYKKIMIYCVAVAVIIAVISLYEQMQTMNRKDTKFDFIAFFIGFSMLVTIGLIIVAIVFMFLKDLTEIQANFWKYLIGIFGSMFMVEAGGGYIYMIFKRKYGYNENKEEEKKIEEPKTDETAPTS